VAAGFSGFFVQNEAESPHFSNQKIFTPSLFITPFFEIGVTSLYM